MSGIANVALVEATSIAGRTRISLETAPQAMTSLTVAFGEHRNTSPIGVPPPPCFRVLFLFAATNSEHQETRRYDEHEYCSRHVTVRPDKSKNCSFRRGRTLCHYAHSSPNKPSQDPCSYLHKLAPSAYNTPFQELHRSHRRRPCLCPGRMATMNNRQGKGASSKLRISCRIICALVTA